MDRNHAFGAGIVSTANTGIIARLCWVAEKIYHRIIDPLKAKAAGYQFLRQASIGRSCSFGAKAVCINHLSAENVQLGDGVICRGLLRVESFGRGHIKVGKNCYIGDDVLLSCAMEISIGPNTLLAHGAQIFDNDSHPIAAKLRLRDWLAIKETGIRQDSDIGKSSVEIGENCWIGSNSLIMKGVSIGENSIVCAGSVVTKNFPAHSLIGGNPAKLLKLMSESEEDTSSFST